MDKKTLPTVSLGGPFGAETACFPRLIGRAVPGPHLGRFRAHPLARPAVLAGILAVPTRPTRACIFPGLGLPTLQILPRLGFSHVPVLLATLGDCLRSSSTWELKERVAGVNTDWVGMVKRSGVEKSRK